VTTDDRAAGRSPRGYRREQLNFAPAAERDEADATTVKSCWLCGIHGPARHMMADGGRDRADVRWYCLDVRGCTERWTQKAAAHNRAYQSDADRAARRQTELPTCATLRLGAKLQLRGRSPAPTAVRKCLCIFQMSGNASQPRPATAGVI
jgi:hypothetical protein